MPQGYLSLQCLSRGGAEERTAELLLSMMTEYKLSLFAGGKNTPKIACVQYLCGLCADAGFKPPAGFKVPTTTLCTLLYARTAQNCVHFCHLQALCNT